MDDCRVQLANLVDSRDPKAVLEEIHVIAGLMVPRFDFAPFDRAYSDVVRLFRGEYPSYRSCNVQYHDLGHTLSVTLAVARLMHGAVEAGQSLTEKDLNMGLISGLMHDTGYIQEIADRQGTGAKYTQVHISRSISFLQAYYRGNPAFQNDLDSFRDILLCTGLNTRVDAIRFAGATVELLGKILGTADLLGQMADRYYLEKLPELYEEFAEAGITTFSSRLDLLDKTQGFYRMTLKRFEDELGNVQRFSRCHFRKRWGIDEDLYIQSIEKNMAYLARVVSLHRENYADHLRRFAHTKEHL
ncbi:MAG: hypothetical protein PHW80_05750 [Smithellaceae bacterium]|jgi:hypothetical protein|nr:hypothetical protein [Smithellaceae bacterium]MDD3848787.1 hypothetical protein [Smithellaceae bacterium]HOQ71318.1 hypothetical protein [Smithellaceae bacterium]HPL09615.1 hypothetical protein [Smithellaceae bacterium]